MANAKRTWFEMKKTADKAKAAEILIYGSIGKSWWDDDAVGAKQFDKDLKALGELDDITVRINSPGGDVFEGVAIFNTLKRHKASKTVVIDGIAASAASLIAMSADDGKLIMPKNSYMLVHGASAICMGTKEDMEKVAADLGRINLSMVDTYASRSGQKADEVKALMLEDRLMTAAEAVELGYADEIGDEVKMAACLDPRAITSATMSVIATKLPDAVIKAEAEEQPPATDADDGEGSGEASDPAVTDDEADEDKTAVDPKAKVVDIKTARKAGAEDNAKYVAEVLELCTLSGAPVAKAHEFIKAKKPISDVRAALLTMRAAGAEGMTEVRGTHATTSVSADAAKKGWGKVVANLNKLTKAGLN